MTGFFAWMSASNNNLPWQTPVQAVQAVEPVIAAPSQIGGLIDSFGRQVRYLRQSVTDRCDFRCYYCMAEEVSFLPREAVMSLEECLRVARVFVGLGVNKLRITGGEPLVRKNILWLLRHLGRLDGLRELVLTTNGSQLQRYARDLYEAGVARINISLDTLNIDRFRQITRIGDLGKVLTGIRAVREAGFRRTKLNTVMMRGVNDDEFVDLVRFAVAEGLDISFIEEMPMGDITGRDATYISAEETLTRLAEHFTLTPSSESSGGPAKYWRINGSESRVGFITPHSDNFCGDCNRVRLTAQGDLHTCLGQNQAVSLLSVMRAHADEDAPLQAAIVEAVAHKAEGHTFSQQMQQPQVFRFMSMTGG